MKSQNLKGIIATAILVITLSSCATSARVVVNRPRRPVMERSVAPHAGWVWISGEWIWHHGGYVYKPGYWVTPRAGYVWQRGHWQHVRHGWRWVEGRWHTA